jgi:hypothetical protein
LHIGDGLGLSALKIDAIMRNSVARTQLIADTACYVSQTGSDSNVGLSSSTAFRTLQKSWDTITDTLDLGGHFVTVQIANGKYAAGIDSTKGVVGAPYLGVNVSNPSNVLISQGNRLLPEMSTFLLYSAFG